MKYRLTGQDLETARSQVAGAGGVQVTWVYDRPVDLAELTEFHAALRRGRLGRVVAPAILGAAGDRWTTLAEFAPLTVDDTPIDRADLHDWFAARASQELRTFAGPAWRLATAPLRDGGAAVSLVVSHSIADGRALLAAVAEAVTDTGPTYHYPADRYGRARLLLADLAAATPRLLSAWGAGIAATVLSLRAKPAPQADPAAPGEATPPESAAEPELSAAARPPAPRRRTVPTLPLPSVDPNQTTGGLTRVTVCVPAERWRATARARGGTPTTLVVAATAELAGQLGRVDDDGLVRMCLPVSLRTAANDHMANALTLVDFPLDPRDEAAMDLAALRATMKRELEGFGKPSASDQRVWRLLPGISRAKWRQLLTAALEANQDHVTTNCSVLGRADDAVARIDGAPAASVASNLTPVAEYVTHHGGILRSSMLEVDGQVSVWITCFHPANPLTAHELRTAVAKVLDGYELDATYW